MIAYRDSTSGVSAGAATVAVTLPPQAEEGDTLLVALLVAGGTGVTLTAPANWDLVLSTTDGATGRLSIYSSRKTSSNGSNPTFTLSGSQAHVWAAVAYGGVDGVTAVDVSGGQANASSTSCTAPSITTTKTNAHLVFVGGSEASARTFTPPSGFTERVDVAGSALSLEVADGRQATIAASGAKVATLSGAAANLGQLVALAPSALNSPAAVQKEGGWRYEMWAPQHVNNTTFLAFLEEQLQLVNAELRARIGRRFYADNLLADPWLTQLIRAEMDLVQGHLLALASQLAESADEQQRPMFLGKAGSLLNASARRRKSAEEVILMARGAANPGPQGPYFRTGSGAAAQRPHFDRQTGLPEEEA